MPDLIGRDHNLIIDQAPILIWLSDTTKSITYLNDTWKEFTGRSLKQEQNVSWLEGIHKDDYDRCKNIYSRSFDERNSFEIEYRLLRHDGKYRWVLNKGVPYYDRSGEFAGYIGYCIDIHDAKLSSDNLENLIHRTSELIAIVNYSRKINYINRAFGYDHRIELTVDCDIRSFIDDRDLRKFEDQFIVSVRDQLAGRIEIRLINQRYYLLDIIPYDSKQMMLVLIDITEQKKIEQTKLEIQKYELESQKFLSLSALAGGIAHDFNNIFSGIKGYLELVKEDMIVNDEISGYVDRISTLLDRATDLSQQLHTYTGNPISTNEPVEIMTLVKQVQDSLKAHSFFPLLKWNVSLETGRLRVHSHELTQVMLELISNSLEASSDENEIVITIEVVENIYDNRFVVTMDQLADRYLVISIEDQGEGIDEEDYNKIFDPYYSTKASGRGLGLALVYGFVKKLGGGISLNNYDDEKVKNQLGTKFSMILPLIDSSRISK